MAAAWCQRHLEDEFIVAEIRSAGTHAWDGAEAAGYAADAMRELDFDLRGHRSQRLTAELIAWADHVVVMEPMHEELARELRASGESSPTIHGLWVYLDGSASEVWDPQGTDLDSYRRSARELGAAMRRLIGQILQQQRGRT